MAYGILGVSPDMIAQQQRIRGLPSDPKETLLAKYLVQLAQQNKVGTPEYYMAAGEFQNRQKMRQEQAAKAQNPPPVVAEITAQAAQKAMPPVVAAPIDRGVAALPAQNVGEYALGGIVSFEDGGEVERFQNQGLVRDPYNYRAFSSPYAMTEEERKELEKAKSLGFIDSLRYTFNRLNPFGGPSLQEVVSGQPLRSVETTTPVQVADMIPVNAPMTQGDLRKQEKGQYHPSMPATTPPYVPKSMQPEVEKRPEAGLPAMDAALKEAEKQTSGQSLTAAERVQQMQDYMKAAGYDEKFFEKQRADIEKQKGETKADRQEAINMRLIEAGLGILGGESPYAFANIGKGASPALKGLQEDFKDIKKLTREYDKAIRDVNTAEQTNKREMGLAALKRADDIDKEIRDRKFDMAKTIYSGKVQMTIAQMPGAQERLIERAMKDPEGFGATAEKFVGRAKSDPMADVVEYYAKNPAALEMLKIENPNLYNAIKARMGTMAVPSVSSAPTGRVRE